MFVWVVCVWFYEQKQVVEPAIIRELVCVVRLFYKKLQTSWSVIVGFIENNIVIWPIVSSRIHIHGFSSNPNNRLRARSTHSLTAAIIRAFYSSGPTTHIQRQQQQKDRISTPAKFKSQLNFGRPGSPSFQPFAGGTMVLAFEQLL